MAPDGRKGSVSAQISFWCVCARSWVNAEGPARAGDASMRALAKRGGAVAEGLVKHVQRADDLARQGCMVCPGDDGYLPQQRSVQKRRPPPSKLNDTCLIACLTLVPPLLSAAA
jgi:hypothetical protein